jgi:hypothetical protein
MRQSETKHPSTCLSDDTDDGEDEDGDEDDGDDKDEDYDNGLIADDLLVGFPQNDMVLIQFPLVFTTFRFSFRKRREAPVQ